MTEKFFDRVYNPMNENETRAFYDEWAKQYEKDVGGAGYATPGRAAKQLAEIAADKSKPILDVGCGTGLSGVAFRLEGFSLIDGIDPSAEMLEAAKGKGVYRSLKTSVPGAPISKEYEIIAAIGVIGCGAAPATLFDDIMDALDPGGMFTLSFNDHALAVSEFSDKLASYTETGKASILAENYGPHLPDLGTNSMSKVYVLQKS